MSSSLPRSLAATRLRPALPYVVVGLAALVWLPPWLPSFTYDGLDSSWRLVLNVAFEQQRQFGGEVVFTFGPWGFLQTRLYHPGTYPWMLGVWSMLSLVLAASLLRLASLAPGWSVRWRTLACLAVIPLIVHRSAFVLDITVLLLLLVTAWMDDESLSPRTAASTALVVSRAILLGALSLCKVSFALPIVVLMILSAGSDIFVSRRVPVPFLTFLASVALFWLLAGQEPARFGAFLAQSFEVAGGYTEAMALGTNWSEPLLFLAFCGLALALLAWHAQASGRPYLRRLLALSFLVYVTLKATYVRHDLLHAPIERAFVLFLGVVVLMVASGAGGPAGRRLRLSVWAFLVLVLVQYRGAIADSVEGLASFPARMRSAIAGPSYAERRVRSLRELVASNRALDPQGSVDIFPTDNALPLAHGLDYRPRPVFQSYAAFTENLAEANRKFLEGASGPDHAFVTVLPIDGRYPSFDDSLSWRTFLSHFDRVALFRSGPQEFVHLRRRPVPRNISLTPLRETVWQSEDGWSPVPSCEGGPVWAQIEVDRGPLDAPVTLLFKPAPLFLQVKNAAGVVRTNRFLPTLGKAGFVLSPLVASARSFGRLVAWDAEVCNPVAEVSALRMLREPFLPWEDGQTRARLAFFRLENQYQ